MTLIYEPAGKAREYAARATNVYTGCDHACTYCYAPSATQKTRDMFIHPRPRPADFLANLEKEASKNPGNGTQVLLCFTCDPYQALDTDLQHTRKVIQILHKYGYSVCILTKGGSRALRDLDILTPADAFATTMTLLSNEHTATWEPGSAMPQERIDTIRTFYDEGIPTWVSLEPVLNPASSVEIIRRTHEFVDLFKVGKLNHHPLENRIDWSAFANQAVDLLESLGKPYYVKVDLLPYLTHPAPHRLAKLPEGNTFQHA